MSILANLTSDDTIAGEKDSVGGFILDSNIYGGKVELAYIKTAPSGALALAFSIKTTDGKNVRGDFWMTSGTAKGCKNYYEDKKGDKQYLPGYIMANALCLLTTGKEINQLEPEEKVIGLYNKEAKAEMPTKVPMLTEVVGQDIAFGLLKQLEDKTEKNPNWNPAGPKDKNNSEYIPTGETRETNEVDKFFKADTLQTTAELRAGADASFHTTWKNKWEGKVKDKTDKDAKGKGGASGAPRKPGAAAAPKTSLFTPAA